MKRLHTLFHRTQQTRRRDPNLCPNFVLSQLDNIIQCYFLGKKKIFFFFFFLITNRIQVYIFLLLINSTERKNPNSFHQKEKGVTTELSDLLTALYLL